MRHTDSVWYTNYFNQFKYLKPFRYIMNYANIYKYHIIKNIEQGRGRPLKPYPQSRSILKMSETIICQINENKIGVKSITVKKKDAEKLNLNDGDYVKIKKLEDENN